MMRDEADCYAVAVRDQVFFATVRAIASLMHPKDTSDAQRSLSLFATVDALLKVIAELLTEAKMLDSPAIETAMLTDLQAALKRHIVDAKSSVADHRGHTWRSGAGVH
jgi:hypothetical protein